MNGEWNSRTRTFSATNDVGNGVKMTATYVLKSEDLIEFRFVAKGGDGKLYFNLKGIGRRVQPAKVAEPGGFEMDNQLPRLGCRGRYAANEDGCTSQFANLSVRDASGRR